MTKESPPCKRCGYPTVTHESLGYWANLCTNNTCDLRSLRNHFDVKEYESPHFKEEYETPAHDPVQDDLQRAHQERNDERLSLSNY
ncbi:zinc-ribbon protein [Caudoviricetes sp.]|nr:zinc-ribbon protein [Caudoviricetes sp.]